MRDTLPNDSPELAGQLAAYSMTLLTLKAWDEAEPLIREALTIREKVEPDDWRTFNTKSMLGGALRVRRNTPTPSRCCWPAMKDSTRAAAAIPPAGIIRLTEALERVVQLYTEWEKPDQTALWKQKLDEQLKSVEQRETAPPSSSTNEQATTPEKKSFEEQQTIGRSSAYHQAPLRR